jgi:hypothetical protein
MPLTDRLITIYQEQHYFTRLNLETFVILMLEKENKIHNVTIPSHFGIQSWVKSFNRDQPVTMQAIKKLLHKKASKSTAPSSTTYPDT